MTSWFISSVPLDRSIEKMNYYQQHLRCKDNVQRKLLLINLNSDLRTPDPSCLERRWEKDSLFESSGE